MRDVADVDGVCERAEDDCLSEVEAALDDAAHAHGAHVGRDAGDGAVVTHYVDHQALNIGEEHSCYIQGDNTGRRFWWAILSPCRIRVESHRGTGLLID